MPRTAPGVGVVTARPRNVPPGIFAPGGGSEDKPYLVARPIIPLEWLLAHPATFPWWGKAIRDNVGAAFVTDTILDLDNGFAGIVTFQKFYGFSGGVQGANGGTNFLLLVNKVPVWRARRQFGASSDTGNMDDMGYDDGLGDTWGEVRVWLEPGAVVDARYNNNGGPANLAVGIMARGYAWPITVWEEWVATGWGRHSLK